MKRKIPAPEWRVEKLKALSAALAIRDWLKANPDKPIGLLK